MTMNFEDLMIQPQNSPLPTSPEKKIKFCFVFVLNNNNAIYLLWIWIEREKNITFFWIYIV